MLVSLPPETILNIGEYLNIHDVYSLVRTARRFHSVLISRLYDLGVNHIFDGKNPVIWAVQNGQMLVLRNLLAKETYAIHAHRLDLIGGTTALHEAVKLENEEAIRLLLRHRTRISFKDKKDETPLTLAVLSNNEKVVRMLTDAGAGRTRDQWAEWHCAVKYAASQGNQSILRLLVGVPEWADATLDRIVRRDALERAALRGHLHILEMMCDLEWDMQDSNAFCAAVDGGKQECVRFFLQQGIDVNMEDSESRAPLIVAVKSQQLGILQLLLDAGADHHIVSEIDDNLVGPLHLAAAAGDVDIFRCLLAARADINATDAEDQTPLFSLILEGYGEEVVEGILGMLLEAGADINHKRNDGSTALHLAVSFGVGAIKLLLEAGADPNIRENDGNGPLHDAKGSDWEIVQCLIEGGADINMLGWAGQTPLMAAALNGSTDLIGALIDAGADTSIPDEDGTFPIHAAAKNRGWEMIDVLAKKGADVQVRDGEGKTALHYTARDGARNCVATLVRAGVPVDATTHDDDTALHLASSGGCTAIVVELLAAGADPMARNNTLVTPLHWAKTRSVVDTLVKAGADVMAVDNTNHTPLHHAAWSGYTEVVRRLLTLCRAKTPDFLIPCDGGRTFLEEAAMYGQTDAITVAHEEGVSLNPPMDGNPPWLSPLHEATAHGMQKTVEYLLTNGADPYSLDLHGRSALDWARLDENMMAIYTLHCDDKVETNPEARTAKLSGTVARIATELLVEIGSVQFYRLGKCLIFLGNVELGRVALGQSFDNSCDLCSKDGLSADGRYVCLSCEEVDLCESCMTEYIVEGKYPGVCREHDFIEITSADKEVLDEEGPRKEWLEGVIAKYGA